MLPSNSKDTKYQDFRLNLIFRYFDSHFQGEKTDSLTCPHFLFRGMFLTLFFTKIKESMKKTTEFWVCVAKGVYFGLTTKGYTCELWNISSIAWQEEQLSVVQLYSSAGSEDSLKFTSWQTWCSLMLGVGRNDRSMQNRLETAKQSFRET